MKIRFGRDGVAAVVLASALASAAFAQQQDGEAQFNAGLTHLREGRATLALEEFRKAIRINGKNPYFQKALGICYMQMGRFPEAVDALRRALQINPYYVDARNDLGSALLMAGKREEGKAELLAAFNDPTNPTPEISARNLGQAYLQEKRWPDAASWFRSSLGRNPQLIDAHLGLADALLAQNRTEEAVRAMEDAVKSSPNEPALLVALGEAYFRAGRFHDAQTRLEEAKAKDPTGKASQKADALLKQFGK
jgi:Flp pilus assembly protein TadD